jgi:hypothetical protein
MRECVEEGVLQAYFDGELSSEQMERVATHIAACAQCGVAAREIENESIMLAEAFEPELSLSVPTGRLRLRLDAAIAGMESQQNIRTPEAKGSRLRSWFDSLAASLAPRQRLGFASLIVVAAFGAIFAFVVLRNQPAHLNVAERMKTADLPRFDAVRKDGVEEGRKDDGNNNTGAASSRADNDAAVAVNRKANGPGVINAGLKRSPKVFTPAPGPINVTESQEVAKVQLLPGEKNYLKVIASLDTAIKSGGDNALRPTLRAEYERNLQVVDEAIAQTRVIAQRNPNDREATDFLLSAYQSKVDLMNTVAEQAQLSTMYR